MKDPLQKWQFVIVSWINCLKLPGVTITSLRELQDNTIFKKILACFKPPIDCLETFLSEKYANVHIKYGLNLCDEEITLLSSLLMSHCCLDSDDEFKTHVINNMNSLNHDLQTAIKCFLEMFIENRNGVVINRDILTQVILDSIPHITTESVPAASCPATPHYSRTLETPRKQCATETQVDIPVIDHDKLMAECHRKLNNLELELDAEQAEKLEIKGRLKTEQDNNKRLVQKYKEKLLEVQKLRDDIAGYENKSSSLEVGKSCKMKILMDEKDSLEVYVTTLLNDISQVQDERDVLETKLKQAKERVSMLETMAEESERAAEKMILDLEKNKIDIDELQERILDQERYIKGMKPELNVSVECDSLTISSYFSPTKVPDESPLSHTVVDLQIKEKDILIDDLKKQLADLNAHIHELSSSHQLASAENQCLKDNTCKLEILLEENKTQFADTLLAVKQRSQELLVLKEKLELTEADLDNSITTNKSLALNCEDFQLKLKNAEECSEHQNEHLKSSLLTISLLETNLEKQSKQAAITIDDNSMLKNKLYILGKELNELTRKAYGTLSCTSDAVVALEGTDHVEPAVEYSDENSFETDLKKLNVVLSEIDVQKKELNQKYFDLASVCEDKETCVLNLREEVAALAKKERKILKEKFHLEEIFGSAEQNIGSLQRSMSDKENEICLLRNTQTKISELLKEVESKFEESRNNNSSLKELYDTLKSTSEAELLALTSQFAALKSEKDWLDLELENLQKNLSSLSHDKDDLLESLNQTKLDGTKTTEDMTNTITMLKEEMETLLNSNQLYCKELESIKQLLSEITASKASLSIICEQVTRKSEDEINKLNDQIQATEVTVSELKSERDLLKTQLIAVNSNFEYEQNKSDKLDKMYKQAIEDRDHISSSLNNQVFSLQSLIEQLQSDKASTSCKLDSTIMRVTELGVENKKLAQEHTVLKDEFSLLEYELQAKEAELEHSRANIESLILKTVDLEKQNCDIESVLNKQNLEISALSEDKRILGISLSEVEQLFGNKTDEVVRLEVLISDTSELLLKTKAELEQSIQDIGELNNRYCTFQAHSDAEMLARSTEIVALKSEKASLDLEVVKYQDSLASLSMERDVLVEAINKIKVASETTVSKMNTDVAILREEVSTLKHSNQLSCKELQSVKTLLGETAASKASLSLVCEQVTRDSEDQINNLVNQIQMIEKVVSEITSERDSLKADVALLNESIVDEKDRSEKLDKIYQKAIQDNDEILLNLNNKILSLESSISQLQNEKDSVANELDAANTKRQMIEKVVSEITSERDSLKADVALLNESIVDEKDRSEKLDKIYQKAHQDNDEISLNLNDKILSLESSISQLQNEKDSVANELDAANTKRQMIEKVVSEITSERDSLKADVALLNESIVDEKDRSEKLDKIYQKAHQDNDEISLNLNNKILSLESSISQLQNEKDSVANELDAANTKRQMIEKVVSEITSERDSLKADVALLNESIVDEKDRSDKLVKIYQKAIQDNEEILLDLNSKILSLQSSISQLQNEKDSVANELDAANTKRQMIEKEVSEITSERDSLKADVALLNESIVDEKDRSEKLDKIYQKAIQDNDEILLNLNNKILSLQASISQMQNEKGSIANELDAANNKLTELTETYRKLSQELKDEITQVHSTLQSREADLELLRTNIELLTVKCNDMQEERLEAEKWLKQKNTEITLLVDDKDVLSLKLGEMLKSLGETEEMLKKTTTKLAECVQDRNNLSDSYNVLKSTYEEEQSLLVLELASLECLTEVVEKPCVPSTADGANNLQKILCLIKTYLEGSLNILSSILARGNIDVDPDHVLISSTIAVYLMKFHNLASKLKSADVFSTLEALQAELLSNQTLTEEELMKRKKELSLAIEREQAILLDNHRLEERCKAASESIASLHKVNSEMVSETQRLIGEKDITLKILSMRNLALVSDFARLSAKCFAWEEVCRKLANFKTNLDPKLECIIAMRNQLDDKLSDIQHKFASIVVGNVTGSEELDRVEVLKTTIDSIIENVEEQHSSISLVLFKCIHSSLQSIQLNAEILKNPNVVDPCVDVAQLTDVDSFQDVSNEIKQLQLSVAGLLSQMAVTSNDVCNLQRICPAMSAQNGSFFDDSLELVQEIPAEVNSSNQHASIIQKVLDSVESTHLGIRNKMKEFKEENMSLLESKALDIKSLEGTIVKQNQEVATLKKDYTKLLNDCSEAQSTVVELRTRLALQEQELEQDRHVNKELKKKMAACYSEADLETQVTRLGAEYEKKLSTAKASMIEIYNQKMSKLEPVRRQHDELAALCKKYTDKILHYESFTKRQNEEMKKMNDNLKREMQEKKLLLIKYSELKERAISYSAVSTDPLVAKQNDVMEQLRYRGHQFSKTATQVLEARHVREDPDDSYAFVQRNSVKTKSINHNISQAFTSADEEGEVFNNTYLADLKAGPVHHEKDRLDELQYRNSLCLPHLKSSYPAETQFHDPRTFKDEDIKMGFNSDVDQSDCSSLNALLLPGERHRKKDRGQTSYQKPGPPTPVKNGGHRSFQGDALSPRVLRDHNTDIAAGVRGKLTTTPGRIRSLFSSSKGKRDENSPQTPRRRLSIFRKSVRGRDEA